MSDIVSEKVCACCKQSFPATLDHFYKSKINKDGLICYCKACHLAKSKKWRDDNADQWQSTNRANVKEWRQNNPEKLKEQQRRKDKRDRETRNPTYLARMKRQVARRKLKADPLVAKANGSNQRAKMRKSRGRIKAIDLNMIYDSQKGLCWWCSKPLNGVWRLDHRIALAKGGSNELNNLCAACPDCNAAKSDKWPWQFNGRLI